MNQLYLSYFLIFVGLLSIGIFFYFKYFINNIISTLAEIISLNKDLNYDVEKFLTTLEPLLLKAGIVDYGFVIKYQDQLLDFRVEKIGKNSISEIVELSDYTIKIKLYPKKYVGENVEKYKIILKTIVLIIQEDLHLKIESTNKSFLNVAKFHTFILHDTKNISQFFQTLNYNIEQCKTIEDKERLFEYLKQSTTTLNDKSTNILKLLELNSTDELIYDKEKINLKEFIENIASIYKLDIDIKENITIQQNKTALYLVVENLIKNIADKKKQEPNIKVDICITKDTKIDTDKENISIHFKDTGTHIENIQKIFEPFYTTKQSGLGIGLYKVKTLLSKIDGDIKVSNSTDGVVFEITLKV